MWDVESGENLKTWSMGMGGSVMFAQIFKNDDFICLVDGEGNGN